jgi:hypothetical protein
MDVLAVKSEYPAPRHPEIRDVTAEELLKYARYLVKAPEYKSNKAGFSAYGNTKSGDKVLLAADNLYDSRIIDAITTALREKGASVDLLITDVGSDREVDQTDEISFFISMGRAEGRERELRLEALWIWNLAQERGYDLLIQGAGGATCKSLKRHAGIPWSTAETFASETVTFPSEVSEAINKVAWDMLYFKGRGGVVRVTDPEGTDYTFSLFEEYYGRPNPRGFAENPRVGHLAGHPDAPFLPKADDHGVIAGTTTHCGGPFPHIKVHVKEGAVYAIEGGGKYGEAWRNLLEKTRDLQYPSHPRPGLFWPREFAIGTHPKVCRPSNYLMRSSWMGMWERYRSGIIHVGIGTVTNEENDQWARQNKEPYGHIHVHLMFPTYEITKVGGQKIKVIDKGHLTALDDPYVRQVASKYGDPDKLLQEAWMPGIPGINVEGDYVKDYASDPVQWIRKELQQKRA